jgi:hypothetical protein
VQSDPIGLRGGLATFAYAGSLPLLQIDPDGRQGIVPLPRLRRSPVAPMPFDEDDPYDDEPRPFDPTRYAGCMLICASVRAASNATCYLLFKQGVYSEEEFVECVARNTEWFKHLREWMQDTVRLSRIEGLK